MADVTISSLNSVVATNATVVPVSLNNTTYKTTVSSIIDSIATRTTGLQVPTGSTEQRATAPTPGEIRYNTTLASLEWYHQSYGWISLVIPNIDTGAGQGLTSFEGADGSIANGVATSSQTKYWLNLQNQGGSYIDYFNYSCNGAGTFSMHTGHQPSWWPAEWVTVQVSQNTPRILNQIQWFKHANACGNVDIYGSNRDINSGNAGDTSLYTFLGRIHCGGYASASDCNLITSTFNPNSWGYRWYLIYIIDSSSSPLTYPAFGARQGWAMYGLRLNKI